MTKPLNIPFIPTLKEYLAHLQVERGVSEHTYKSYERDLLSYFTYLGKQGVTRLEKITTKQIESYLSKLYKLGYASASIDRAISAIRGFHAFLVRERILESSPAEGLPRVARPRKLPRVLSVDEVDKVIDQFDGLDDVVSIRDQAILELLYSGGLRATELCSITLLDLNLEDEVVLVQGKGSKERVAPIGHKASKAISRYLNVARPELAAAAKLGSPLSSELFLSTRGRPLSRVALYRIVKQAGELAGIKDLHPHIFRHSYATHMLEGGADLRSLQELLGHSDLSTTQIYTHIEQGYLRDEYLAKHPRSRKRMS